MVLSYLAALFGIILPEIMYKAFAIAGYGQDEVDTKV